MNRWIGVPLVIVLGDGALKKCAEKKLVDGKTKKLFGGHVCLQLLHNPGIALGALEKKPKFVLVINSVMLGVAACEFGNLITQENGVMTKAGLALLIGGGASNLLDRMQRGYVTDYVSFDAGKHFQGLKKVVFNCSDFCVFAGLLCYLIGRSKRS